MSKRAYAALPWLLAAACLVYDPDALAAEPKRVCGLLFATLGLGWVLVRSSEPCAFHPALRALLACVAALSLSALVGAPGRWLVLGNWWLFGGLATALAPLGAERARSIATRTALLVGAATCIWIIGAWLLGRRGMQLHAGQGNPNWAGLLLAVAWPLALADPWVTRCARLRALVLALVFGAALVLSESRVGWVAAALSLLIAAAMSSSRAERIERALQLGVLVTCVSVYVALPSAPKPHSAQAHVEQPLQRARRASELDRSASTSIRGRLWIQRSALDAMVEHLPFGTGLGGFFPAFLEEQGKRLARLAPAEANRRFSNATTAHNDWIELAVEASPLAPLLLLAAFGLALRAWLAAREPAFAATLVSASVAALGDSPLHLPAVCILLALAFAALPAVDPARPASPRTRYLTIALFGGAALLLPCSLAAWLTTRMATAAWLRPPVERVFLLARAARLASDSAERELELGLARRDTGDVRGAVWAIQRATALGGDVASHIALGAAYLDVSEPSRAQRAFEHALSLSPGSVRAHSGLSEALRRLHEFERAEAHAALASQLLPGDADLRARLDAIREERMDYEIERGGELPTQ